MASIAYVERLGTVGVKVFENGSKRYISDLHNNVHPHVSHETKEAFRPPKRVSRLYLDVKVKEVGQDFHSNQPRSFQSEDINLVSK
ncbi:hypothetical protein TNCV_5029921 [Trichonephila clavipes]|nr:hypothetical protein TNCV_5029921 [Trichonephila clavipes]